MSDARTYPAGVPCWVDTDQPDPHAAAEFYGQLFGWEFTDVLPAGAPASYLIATVDGRDVGAIGSGAASKAATWSTYVAVTDVGDTVSTVAAAGGRVTDEPADAGPGGRSAGCVDPAGARFRLWQARARLGAQLVNAPGAWNFSFLRADAAHVSDFYAAVFGWTYADLDVLGVSVRLPGYGRHLAETIDPHIYERQAGAPEGFADVVAGIQPPEPDVAAHWHVSFGVADRDDAVADVQRLGGRVHGTRDTDWTREAEVIDPWGAPLTLSQFTPPG